MIVAKRSNNRVKDSDAAVATLRGLCYGVPAPYSRTDNSLPQCEGQPQPHTQAAVKGSKQTDTQKTLVFLFPLKNTHSPSNTHIHMHTSPCISSFVGTFALTHYPHYPDPDLDLYRSSLKPLLNPPAVL